MTMAEEGSQEDNSKLAASDEVVPTSSSSAFKLVSPRKSEGGKKLAVFSTTQKCPSRRVLGHRLLLLL